MCLLSNIGALAFFSLSQRGVCFFCYRSVCQKCDYTVHTMTKPKGQLKWPFTPTTLTFWIFWSFLCFSYKWLLRRRMGVCNWWLQHVWREKQLMGRWKLKDCPFTGGLVCDLVIRNHRKGWHVDDAKYPYWDQVSFNSSIWNHDLT